MLESLFPGARRGKTAVEELETRGVTYDMIDVRKVNFNLHAPERLAAV